MKKGFTLIEVIIAVGITVLLAGSAVVSFNTYNQNQQVKQAALTLKTNLRLAQAKALSGQKPNGVACTRILSYTVNFFSTPTQGYTVDANCTEGDTPVTSVDLPPTVWFLTVPAPIAFATVTGRTDAPATVTLLGTHSGYRISMSPSGQISDTGFVQITPTPAPIPTSTPIVTPIPTIPGLPTLTPTPNIVPSPTPTPKSSTPTPSPTQTPTPPIVPSPTPTPAPGWSCANNCSRIVTGGPYATQLLCQASCK